MLSFVAGKTLILSITTISHTKDFCKLVLLQSLKLRISTNYQLSIATISQTEYCYKRSSCQSLGIDTSFYHVQSVVAL